MHYGLTSASVDDLARFVFDHSVVERADDGSSKEWYWTEEFTVAIDPLRQLELSAARSPTPETAPVFVTMTEILREYRMAVERVPAGERAVNPRALGRRSKLGGVPDLEHDAAAPTCPECQEPMTFVAQLDSIEHDDRKNPHAMNALGDEQQYLFADVGMVYVFVCLSCNEAAAFVQSG
jgi:hypothetical protein